MTTQTKATYEELNRGWDQRLTLTVRLLAEAIKLRENHAVLGRMISIQTIYLPELDYLVREALAGWDKTLAEIKHAITLYEERDDTAKIGEGDYFETDCIEYRAKGD